MTYLKQVSEKESARRSASAESGRQRSVFDSWIRDVYAALPKGASLVNVFPYPHVNGWTAKLRSGDSEIPVNLVKLSDELGVTVPAEIRSRG